MAAWDSATVHNVNAPLQKKRKEKKGKHYFNKLSRQVVERLMQVNQTEYPPLICRQLFSSHDLAILLEMFHFLFAHIFFKVDLSYFIYKRDISFPFYCKQLTISSINGALKGVRMRH